jgi:hypothetical protein
MDIKMLLQLSPATNSADNTNSADILEININQVMFENERPAGPHILR